jgi:hypothetical protein
MSETAISKAVRAALQVAGYRVTRVQSGAIHMGSRTIYLARTGTPDLLVEGREGLVGWLEVKVPGKALRPEQAAHAEESARRGIPTALVTSAKEALEAVRGWEHRA